MEYVRCFDWTTPLNCVFVTSLLNLNKVTYLCGHGSNICGCHRSVGVTVHVHIICVGLRGLTRAKGNGSLGAAVCMLYLCVQWVG